MQDVIYIFDLPCVSSIFLNEGEHARLCSLKSFSYSNTILYKQGQPETSCSAQEES